ncbi:hypothetical protein F4780DRAFT_780189 [Xylariomycetidae sp. FL0641]|nr:hypothetical protein F4780DRAFT_780189 [Xylariomycetidae sp. FL0641]
MPPHKANSLIILTESRYPDLAAPSQVNASRAVIIIINAAANTAAMDPSVPKPRYFGTLNLKPKVVRKYLTLQARHALVTGRMSSQAPLTRQEAKRLDRDLTKLEPLVDLLMSTPGIDERDPRLAPYRDLLAVAKQVGALKRRDVPHPIIPMRRSFLAIRKAERAAARTPMSSKEKELFNEQMGLLYDSAACSYALDPQGGLQGLTAQDVELCNRERDLGIDDLNRALDRAQVDTTPFLKMPEVLLENRREL